MGKYRNLREQPDEKRSPKTERWSPPEEVDLGTFKGVLFLLPFAILFWIGIAALVWWLI